MRKKVIVIGAGPGGLSCAMLLAYRGYDVTVFEKESEVGGRSAPIRANGYTFDIGPTFLMLPRYLQELFTLAGKNASDYIKLKRLDPLYRLKFQDDTEFFPSSDMEKMIAELKRVFPDEIRGFLNFIHKEEERFKKVENAFSNPYMNFKDFLRLDVLKIAPDLDLFSSVYEKLSRYFNDDKMRLAMSFQTKYIGMSPWSSPSFYTLISFLEHHWGIYHVMGGLNKISQAMADIITGYGGIIRTSTPVKNIIIDKKRAKGVILTNGEKQFSDYIVINADFAYAMSHLINPDYREKYTDAKLKNREYSCSTFMMYIGAKKRYNMNHHNLIFGDGFRRLMDNIYMTKKPSYDSLIYVHNPIVTDGSLAPENKSPLYILVPVPNNKASVDWGSLKDEFRQNVLETLSRRTELTDLSGQTEFEEIITPADWETKYNVYNGAVFNLAHGLNQMFYFRPHNRCEELQGCYLTGGGTQPGSGLPAIYLSAMISTQLLIRDDTGHNNWSLRGSGGHG